ncbi:MAG: ATP-binding protein [Candidatus Eremiobacterota bacterium]
MLGVVERLRQQRHSRFVGRREELGAFQEGLQWGHFALLYLHGPAGIGKTTLMDELSFRCRQRSVRTGWVDLESFELNPESLTRAIHDSLELKPEQPFLHGCGEAVLFLDNFERAAGLEGWLRNALGRSLPPGLLVVVASRQAPAGGWKTDPGWSGLVRPQALRNLSPDDSREYLQKRGVPETDQGPILEFTHGHPLALSLAADSFEQNPDFRFHPEDTAHLFRPILEVFLAEVPSPEHRQALEASALVRVTTEDLLAELVGSERAYELFQWLRGLSFMHPSHPGVFPHELARNVLASDLRWRNPSRYADLHRKIRTFYASSLHRATAREQQRILMDYVYLHRLNPVVKPFFDWEHLSGFYLEPARPADESTLMQWITRHEGPESERLARRYFQRCSEHFQVVRDSGLAPRGFLAALPLSELDPEDPAVAVARFQERQAPLRAGEKAVLFRYWMDGDTYQDVSPVQSMIFVAMVRHNLTTPTLATTYMPFRNHEFWAPMALYSEMARAEAADYSGFGVYAHDWRRLPPAAWLDLLGDRELDADVQRERPTERPSLLVLSQEEFALAVRRALQNLSSPQELRGNPLLRTRLMATRCPVEGERPQALREWILEIARGWQENGRLMKLYRAMEATFIHPAPTQEKAAERLDVPFSSYRRHLSRALDLLTRTLWERELEG